MNQEQKEAPAVTGANNEKVLLEIGIVLIQNNLSYRDSINILQRAAKEVEAKALSDKFAF